MNETESSNLFFRIFDAPNQNGTESSTASRRNNVLAQNQAKVRRQILLAKRNHPPKDEPPADDLPVKDESAAEDKEDSALLGDAPDKGEAPDKDEDPIKSLMDRDKDSGDSDEPEESKEQKEAAAN